MTAARSDGTFEPVLEPPARRRAGPTSMVVLDLLRNAGVTRSWLAFAAQTAAPWAIYPAL
jgi:hypothetical protein